MENANVAIALLVMLFRWAWKLFNTKRLEGLMRDESYCFLSRVFFDGGCPCHSIMSDGWTQCGMTTGSLRSIVGLRLSCCSVRFSSGLRCTISKFPDVSRIP